MATHSGTLAWKIPWTVAVHGVAQSRTRLKRLSSSSRTKTSIQVEYYFISVQF